MADDMRYFLESDLMCLDGLLSSECPPSYLILELIIETRSD